MEIIRDELVEEYVHGYIILPILEAFKEDILLDDTPQSFREFSYPLETKDKTYIARYGVIRFLMGFMKYKIYATFAGPDRNTLFLYRDGSLVVNEV